MGLLKFIKGEFLEVVQWEDQSEDTMVWKFPVADKQQIKEGAQLIVRPSQVAVFVYQGQVADVYEPGKYELNTDTMPVLTTLSNWKYLFENHFKTDVYFINTKQFINQKWGTPNPVMMRDLDFGLVRLRAFGTYSFRVSDPVTFLKEVFGTNTMYTVDSLNDQLKSLVVSVISDTLGEAKIPAIELAAQYVELGHLVKDHLQERFGSLGLEVAEFAIENISLPEEVEKAIDKRSSMGAVGNLDQYMKYQSAEAIRDAAKNPNGGMASMGAGMGAGMGIGQAMMSAMAQGTNTANTPAAPVSQEPISKEPISKEQAACPNCSTPVDAQAKFCPECGTKMGGACSNCGTAIAPGVKFCPECGTKV